MPAFSWVPLELRNGCDPSPKTKRPRNSARPLRFPVECRGIEPLTSRVRSKLERWVREFDLVASGTPSSPRVSSFDWLRVVLRCAARLKVRLNEVVKLVRTSGVAGAAIDDESAAQEHRSAAVPE